MESVFFQPGDTVTLRQELTNKPVMVVKSVDKASDMNDKPSLLGITCFWFNEKKEVQTHRFSTKDLMHTE